MYNLKEWRLQQGWSRSVLAEKVQVHESTVKRWEQGKTMPFPYNMGLLVRLGFLPFAPSPGGKMEKDAKNEQPSTYIVQDRSNQQELERLVYQDQMFTTIMGGPLADLPHPEHFQRILDVGCGTGGWLRETARTYPTISSLIGVDISKKMLDYARNQTLAQGLSDRVEYLSMDALRMLEFPDKFFDLVNLRFGQSYLRTWDWLKLLQEFRRVIKPGGIVRVTDTLLVNEEIEAYPALSELCLLLNRAFAQAGHALPDIEKSLPELLARHGFIDAKTRLYVPTFTAGTKEGQMYIEDLTRIFKTTLPFLQKWTRVPENYEDLYQQLLKEFQEPNFTITWPIVTSWAIRA